MVESFTTEFQHSLLLTDCKLAVQNLKYLVVKILKHILNLKDAKFEVLSRLRSTQTNLHLVSIFKRRNKRQLNQ